MPLLKPLWMQPASGDAAINYSAQEDRAGLLGAVFSREGVLDVDAGQLLLAPRAAGANYSVDVRAGRAAIQGDNSSDQGTYVCTATTTENIAVFSTGVAITRPASGTRRHRVIARVRDKLHNGAVTAYDCVLEILQDTGSGPPAQPASAITLGFLNMTSTMTSIQAANIEDARPRASVGTPARTGSFTINPDWTVDPARPPTWHVNTDGWVSLAGWCRWTVGINVNLTPYQFYRISGAPLPAAVRSAAAFRDFPAISSMGPMQMTLQADGHLYYLFVTNQTLINNQSWVSFDGCGYRL